MRLEALIDAAKEKELEMKLVEAERKAAAEQIQREELAAADANFRAWLGDLADDLEISEPRLPDHSNGRTEWRVRPRTWKLADWKFGVMQTGGYEWWLEADDGRKLTTRDIGSAGGPDMAALMLDAQRLHDKEVERQVAAQVKTLATAHDTGCSDDAARLRAARARLQELAPKQASKWNSLIAQSLEKLEEWRTEEAEKLAVRAAAVDRYEEAYEAWVAECAEVRARNAAVAERLREKLGDVSLQVCEVEYAAVIVWDGENVLETRSVWALANTAGARMFQVIERGRIRLWEINHVVRTSGPVTATPAEYPDLFARIVLGGQPVYYLHFMPAHKAAVDAAVAELRVGSMEPDWKDFGPGLMWGTDFSAALQRAKGIDPTADEDDAPF